MELHLVERQIQGGSQGAPFATVTTSASLAHLMTLYPSCATSAQIKGITGNLPLVGAVPACVSYIYVQQNDGLLNLDAQGVDTDFEYIMPTTIGACSPLAMRSASLPAISSRMARTGCPSVF